MFFYLTTFFLNFITLWFNSLITVSYGGDLEVAMGNTLKPSETQETPEIHVTFNAEGLGEPTIFTAGSSSSTSASDISTTAENTSFTLAMTDPDAPSRTDKSFSEYCHFLVSGIKLKAPSKEDPTSDIASKLEFDNANVLVPYMGPGPPEKTGKHRYVFVLLRETKPQPTKYEGDRARWGTQTNGYGLKEYAAEHGLIPVAVNFFYAQNDVQ